MVDEEILRNHLEYKEAEAELHKEAAESKKGNKLNVGKALEERQHKLAEKRHAKCKVLCARIDSLSGAMDRSKLHLAASSRKLLLKRMKSERRLRRRARKA